MDNNAMAERIRTIFSSDDPAALSAAQYEMQTDQTVQEWPQSGEIIRGRDNIRAVNETYARCTGASPKIKVRRFIQLGQAWIIEGTIDYGDGVPVSTVAILETDSDGKISHETDYFANPFEAPAWRSEWVESAEPVKSS